MSSPADPVFLVNPHAEPVAVRIQGRANYLNSGPLGDFFRRLTASGTKSFVLDFQNCTAVDSTFLGILAGAALELRRQSPPGKMRLCRLSPRNLELVRNLGLHRILEVESGDFPMDFGQGTQALAPPASPIDERASARMILHAHEHLVEAEGANRARFQDVITFLKSELGKE